MTNTILIEQTAKNIKLAEAIVLAVLFSSIAAGLGYRPVFFQDGVFGNTAWD